ncbi:hypothetical protein CK203_020189 [Vitis vinifera]|uniref:Reverse transcriptase Ty1/copia-type domain-containing protein n=1 Tax=Vitis vinifera TaxID=29760 RepID=A0A438J7Z4_VITVI|nr:hypothetical protein CK203_020189 [Vitis vinifera]
MASNSLRELGLTDSQGQSRGIGDHKEEMHQLKAILAKEFEIKDLGALKYFLSMKAARSSKDTPMDPTNKVGMKEDSAPIDEEGIQGW